jgi:hypothetical protein
MNRYHINRQDQVGLCTATKGTCPFGGSDAHYSSKKVAQLVSEKKLAAELGSFSDFAKDDSLVSLHDRNIQALIDNRHVSGTGLSSITISFLKRELE